MNNATETTQTQKAITVAAPTVETQLSHATLAITIGSASLVSLWSFAGLVGAVLNHGPLEIARGMITALTGI